MTRGLHYPFHLLETDRRALWGKLHVLKHVASPRVSELTHGPRQTADTPGAPSSLLLPSPGRLHLMAETSALYTKQPLAACMLQPRRFKSSGADSGSPHTSGCIVVFGG